MRLVVRDYLVLGLVVPLGVVAVALASVGPRLAFPQCASHAALSSLQHAARLSAVLVVQDVAFAPTGIYLDSCLCQLLAQEILLVFPLIGSCTTPILVNRSLFYEGSLPVL